MVMTSKLSCKMLILSECQHTQTLLTCRQSLLFVSNNCKTSKMFSSLIFFPSKATRHVAHSRRSQSLSWLPHLILCWRPVLRNAGSGIMVLSWSTWPSPAAMKLDSPKKHFCNWSHNCQRLLALWCESLHHRCCKGAHRDCLWRQNLPPTGKGVTCSSLYLRFLLRLVATTAMDPCSIFAMACRRRHHSVCSEYWGQEQGLGDEVAYWEAVSHMSTQGIL